MLKNVKYKVCVALVVLLTGFSGAEVYVKNKPFKGESRGSGYSTMVQAEAILKALKFDDYKLDSEKLVIGGESIPVKESMISLKALSELIGAKLVVNTSLGTVDVYRDAKLGTGAGTTYASSPAKEDQPKREYFKPVKGWVTDWDEAARESKRTGKPIMMNFTGSDWCGWCMKLKAEVFDTPEFKQWADKTVVLLELDFPKGKKLPEELQEQNQRLQQKFQVSGYPSIIWADHEGNQVGTRYGYGKGGPEAWIKAAESNMRPTR